MTGIITAQINNGGGSGYGLQLSTNNFSTIAYSGSLQTPDEFGLVKFTITGIPNNNQSYSARIINQSGVPISGLTGSFVSPHATTGITSFAFASCSWSNNSSASNAPVYDFLLQKANSKEIQFFIHMGDLFYGDINTNDEALYQQNFNKVFSSPKQNALWSKLPMFYMWDDHDFGPDAGNKNNVSRNAAITAYRRRVPIPATAKPGNSQSPYYSFVRGRSRFIFTDLRSERETNGAYISTDDRQKIMSTEQEEWLYSEFLKAKNSGQVIIWISTVPWVASITNGNDHWGGFHAARSRISNFIILNSLQDRIVILSGDMHALAYDDGTSANNFGQLKVCHAGPLDQVISSKGGPYKIGPITKDSNTGWATQYGIIDITDNGGSSLNIRYKGISVSKISPFAETVEIDVNFNLNCSIVSSTICNQNTSYLNPQGKGDRRSSAIVLSSNFATYTIAEPDWAELSEKTMIDGIRTRDNVSPYFWFGNSSNPNGKYFIIDFGPGNSRLVTEIKIIKDDLNYDYSEVQNWRTWQVQGSNDGSNWNNIGSPQVVPLIQTTEEDLNLGFGAYAKQAIFNLCGNNNAYRYYKLTLQSTSPMVAQALYEIEFKIDNPAKPEIPISDGLFYWLAASDNTVTIAPSTVNQVSGWLDKSNPLAGRAVLNSLEAGLTRPTFIQSGANLEDAIRFSGTSKLQYPQTLTTNDASIQLNNTTVFCVSKLGNTKYDNVNPGRIFSFIPPKYSTSPNEDEILHPNGASIAYIYNGFYYNVGLVHSGLAQWYSINRNPRSIGSDYFSCCFRLSDTGYIAYINERKVSTNLLLYQGRQFGGGSVGNSGAGAYAIGKGNKLDSSALNGDVVELLIYNRLLSEQEISTINSHLKNKYALTDEYAGVITSQSVVQYPQDTVSYAYSQGVSFMDDRPGSVYILGYNSENNSYFPFYKMLPTKETTYYIGDPSSSSSSSSSSSTNSSSSSSSQPVIDLPAGILGVYAWYKTEEGMTFSAPTNELISWDDSVGNSNLIAGQNKPVVLENALNGYSVVSFTNDDLIYNGAFPLDSSTIFIVTQVDNISSFPRVVSWQPSAGNDNSTADGANISYNSTNQVGLEHNNSSVRSNFTDGFLNSIRPTKFFTICTTLSSSNFQLYLNGLSRNNNNPSFFASRPFSAQCAAFKVGNGTDSAQPFQGKIVEIIVYNRVLSESEMLDLHEYAETKYALKTQFGGGGTGPTNVPFGESLIFNIGGTASANSFSVGFEPEKAADADDNTKWFSPFNSSYLWQYDFGQNNSKNITAYRLRTALDNTSADPWSWTLAGSDVGLFEGEEEIIDTVTASNITTTRGAWSIYYNCDNPSPTPYRYYRWTITATRVAGAGCHVGQFEAFDYNPITCLDSTTSYDNRDGAGNRSSSVFITTNLPTVGNISSLYDGLFNNGFSFVAGQSSGEIIIRLNETRVIDQITIYKELPGDFGTWRVQGSGGNGQWVNIGPIQTPLNSYTTYLTCCGNGTAYRNYRLFGQNTANGGALIDQTNIWEMEFKINDAPNVLTDPAQINNIYAWYRSDNVTIGAGNVVNTWPDMVNARNLVSESTNKPTLVSNVLNGRPVVRFPGGTSSRLSYNAAFALNNTTTFIVVSNSQTSTTSPRLVNWMPGGTANEGNAANGYSFYYVAGTANNLILAHEGLLAARGTVSRGHSARAFAFTANSSGSLIFYNNNIKNTSYTVNPFGNSPFSATSASFRIGQGTSTTATNTFIGDIAEIIVYDRVLTDSEIESVNNYLNTRYNLWSFTSQDFYDVEGNVIDLNSFIPPLNQKFGSEIAIDNSGEYIFVGGPQDQRVPEITQGAIWCYTGNGANGWDFFQKIISEDPDILNVGSQNIVVSPDYSTIMAGTNYLPVLFSGSKENGWFYIQEIDYEGFDRNSETPIYFDSYNASANTLFLSTYSTLPFSSGNGKINLIAPAS